MRPTISVAVTTFNGARFVRSQRESILAQSIRPLEIVVSDDGSSDDTTRILEEIASEHPGLVRVIGGSHLGLRGNVQRAVAACSGDVIALADQDDVWHEAKLEAIGDAFAAGDVTLWFSDAVLIDETDSPLGRSAWESVHLDPATVDAVRVGRGLERLIHGQTVTGATMALRRSVLDVALPLPDDVGDPGDVYLHDGWFAVLASVLGRTVADSAQYVSYRQHPDQVTMMTLAGAVPGETTTRRRASSWAQLNVETRRIELVLDRLIERGRLKQTREQDSAWLADRRELLEVRTAPPGLGRILGIARLALRGRYAKHGLGWRAVVVDLVGLRARGHA